MNPQQQVAALNFHILTLLPEVVEGYLKEGVIGRAVHQGLVGVRLVQLRDFSEREDRRVDDKPYGGGEGMVIRADVVARALTHLKQQRPKSHIIFLNPGGKLFHNDTAKRLATKRDITLVCGRYDGIDRRAIDAYADEEISIGDFVLSGGELAALCILDATARFLPGVLGNATSASRDSFGQRLLEGPLYTRPPEFEGRTIPAELMSGNHQEIESFRRRASLEQTAAQRPDIIFDVWDSLTKKEQNIAQGIMKRGKSFS